MSWLCWTTRNSLLPFFSYSDLVGDLYPFYIPASSPGCFWSTLKSKLNSGFIGLFSSFFLVCDTEILWKRVAPSSSCRTTPESSNSSLSASKSFSKRLFLFLAPMFYRSSLWFSRCFLYWRLHHKLHSAKRANRTTNTAAKAIRPTLCAGVVAIYGGTCPILLFVDSGLFWSGIAAKIYGAL